MKSKWFVRVVRFDGSKGSETEHNNYVDAKKAFDTIDQLNEDERDKAGGRCDYENHRSEWCSVRRHLIADIEKAGRSPLSLWSDTKSC